MSTGVRVERDGTSVTESHIWKYTIADQAVRQLSFVNEVVSDLRLSPDGKMLAFTSRRDGKLGLYLLNAPGVLAKRTD
ncbi:MAG: PD40 domain-containing protein [Ignavibacteriales bacterium]|nr:PD40 domain-containing protein [Ignavibacteriales bacterium]